MRGEATLGGGDGTGARRGGRAPASLGEPASRTHPSDDCFLATGPSRPLGRTTAGPGARTPHPPHPPARRTPGVRLLSVGLLVIPPRGHPGWHTLFRGLTHLSLGTPPCLRADRVPGTPDHPGGAGERGPAGAGGAREARCSCHRPQHGRIASTPPRPDAVRDTERPVAGRRCAGSSPRPPTGISRVPHVAGRAARVVGPDRPADRSATPSRGSAPSPAMPERNP